MAGMWRKCQWRLGVVLGSVSWLLCSPVCAVDYETLMKGVVKITTGKETGAGIVVGVDGDGVVIVTALHVVADATDIQVLFRGKLKSVPGSRYEKYYNEPLDLAVITVEVPSEKARLPDLLPLALGNVETLDLGAEVLVIGHPLDNDWEVSALVNKLQRKRDEDSRFFRFTNISIERGNSGGPVFDNNGRLIGMVKKKMPPDRTVALKISEVVNLLRDLGLNASLLGEDNGVPSTVTKPTGTSTRVLPLGMVSVVAGDFFMGCNEKVDTECDSEEKPGRTVNLPVFSIDKTEVTVAQFAKCVEAGKCSDQGLTMPYYFEKEQPEFAWACNWGKAGREQHPMNCVDWSQAQAFCAWEDKRLPSEAEWEKAARGTDGRKYPWGNVEYSKAGKVANIADETAKKSQPTWEIVEGYDDGFYGTAPVGSFPAGASPAQALDVMGNVGEWTADWYDEKKEARVVRGGSWADLPRRARASYRARPVPGNRYELVGFRCAQ